MTSTTRAGFFHNAWVQLCIGVICMACVANLQYSWTLFVHPIDARFHWGRPAIQVAFTLFVVVETWLAPLEGYLVDRYGPRPVVLLGGVLVAVAWLVNSIADSLVLLYLGAVIGGLGAGAVYGTCVGNALKWFPGRRGFAAGITAAGFGAGAALTVAPISRMIQDSGYQHTYVFFAILQGTLVVIMALGLRKAPMALLARARTSGVKARRQFSPTEVLSQPVFWVMYLMFVMVASSGLMFAASIASVARDFHVDAVPMQILGVVFPALTVAISLDRILDGIGRPLFGWISDRIGRELTMCIAFSAGAVAFAVLSVSAEHAVLFVIVSGLYFMVFGEIYSLFPATQGDTFGAEHAAANAGMLYTAKGTAALLVPLASTVATALGWHVIFYVGILLNSIAAALAIVALKPMRTRLRLQLSQQAGEPADGSDLASTPALAAKTP